MYMSINDSTLVKICDRNGVYVIQESVDVSTMWTEQNDMHKRNNN